MNKINLNSVPSQDVERIDYLIALEKAILNLPLSEVTKAILKMIFSYDESNPTLLFQMLDKGVIYTPGEKPSDWSNDVQISLQDVRLHIPSSVKEEDIREAFEEVNKYLEGFAFVLSVISHAWLFYYISESFEKSFRKQMRMLF